MADGLDQPHTPDMATMFTQRLGLRVDPCLLLLDLLRTARTVSETLTGHDARWTMDVRNALSDIIAGVEAEVGA